MFIRYFLVQSDPYLVTSSGERVLVTKSGSNNDNFLYRGKFILSLNPGVTKSGGTKSGSDCTSCHVTKTQIPNAHDKSLHSISLAPTMSHPRTVTL
eukprot:sb/3479148/